MQTRQTNFRKKFGLMQTRQTNVRKEHLFQVDFYGWVGKSRVQQVSTGREFSENPVVLIQTRQTNVTTEVLFQVDF